MRRFLLINVLSLFIGYGMSQTATIAGDFSQGLRCVEPGVQSAMLELRNASSNSAGVTGIKWEVKDAVTGTIIHTQTYPSNFSPYTAIISQAGTYWAVMTVWWANVERMDSMKFVVHSMPQFSFAKNTDSICPGEGITFNYSMASPFTQGMVKSVVWDFGDGGTSTQNAPTYNYLNGQNREVSYPVSLTVTDTNQCASRLEYSNFVFVRTKPRTGFAADNAYFCFGGATAPEGKPVFTNYTDTGIAGVNNTYRWSFGDGTTSTSEHETHTYMPGVYPVTLVATSQHGCVDSVVKSNYIRVVKLTPVFTLEDTVICSLPDTIYPIGRNGNSVEYDWEIDNIMNGRPILREPTFIFRKQDVGTHTLRYTIIDKTGDGSCSVDTFVTLHLFDKIPSEITATDTNECDPDHVITFNNTTSYPWPDDFGKAQTNWDFYDGTTGTGHTTTHTYGVSAVPDDIYAYPDGGYGNYRVKMTGTTPYGCPLEPVYQYIHIFRMHAVGTVIDPAPPDPPHGCVPHTVTLANIPDSLISSSEIISYVWRWNFDETGTNPNADPKDTTLGSISGEEPHTYEDTGRYNVYLTLTNKQGCVHDIFVKYIMVGDTVLVDFKFEPDTNCKDLISIKVTAYDSLNSDGSLAGDAWADGWTWLDENDTPIGGPTDTTEVHPQNPGPVTIKLQASHLGCNSYFVPVVSGVDVGIVCPPVATIKDPHDDPPGQHPVYCGFETIPFISDSKGAIYQRWYAGDYYPYVPKDTVRQSKGPLIKWDATLGDYIQYDANGDSVGTGADWEFLYSDSSATDYLMKLNGVITLSLWAMNDSSVTDDPSDPMFNLCGYCDNWAEQIILISHARMNFTVSDDALCQGDSVRFYDSTQSSVGLFGWGFKFDSAWNTSYIEDYITIGKIIPQENYMPDPKYGHGYWLPFS
ncbi:MAG: PKD domain-containing protein, partial [Tannerellaceae bacterium]|nr:PKD domain-containing protein [Tannerellaceae bacterium]